MKILVTGANGFIGKHIVNASNAFGAVPISQTRKPDIDLTNNVVVEGLTHETDWGKALDGVECVVHCSALVHQMGKEMSYRDYYDVNVLGTENLAKQAAESGVKRFVFLSSIKVNGEYSAPRQPFTPSILSEPEDFYGKSKYEAESCLKNIAKETGMEVVIIRPPLVYGPGVKANFFTLMRLISKRLPLPFGSIDNKRSLVYVENLVDLVLSCCRHPQAVGKTFLVSDNHDVSTTDLLKAIAKALRVKSFLIPVPRGAFRLAAVILRKPELETKLFGFLQVDISETKETLGWKPPYTFEEGIQKTVDDYISIQK